MDFGLKKCSILFQLYDLYTTTFSPTEASLRKELVGFKATTGIFIILCAATLTCAGTLLYLHAIYKRNRPVSVHYVLQKDPQHSFDST
ncbi:Neuroligin-like protein [Trichinella spiralis]|uniref:Neuroligin-like protein n=1 Tax=Trichinella spiralis TaxID=6334 RepID=A0ABR3K243_TRISP